MRLDIGQYLRTNFKKQSEPLSPSKPLMKQAWKSEKKINQNLMVLIEKGVDVITIMVSFHFQQLALPRPDEWNRLVNTLQELQANQATIGDLERPLSPTSSLASSLVSPGRI